MPTPPVMTLGTGNTLVRRTGAWLAGLVGALPRAPTEPLSEHPCWLLMAGLPAPGIPGTLISRLSTRSSWTRALMRRFRAGTGQFAWRCGPVRRGHPALGGWGSWRLVAASRDW